MYTAACDKDSSGRTKSRKVPRAISRDSRHTERRAGGAQFRYGMEFFLTNILRPLGRASSQILFRSSAHNFSNFGKVVAGTSREFCSSSGVKLASGDEMPLMLRISVISRRELVVAKR